VEARETPLDVKEEEKVMTLDEWKAQEDGKRAKADFNIRKPGEGCNGDPQWTKMVALTKKEKTEGVDDDEELVSEEVLTPNVMEDVRSKLPPCQHCPDSINSKWSSCTEIFNCRLKALTYYIVHLKFICIHNNHMHII